MPGELTLRTWDEDEWSRSRPQWDALCQDAGADPLFQSFEWQWLWWTRFVRGQGTLCLIAGYRGEHLIGLAPLVALRIRRGPLRLRSIQCLGGALRESDLYGAMSEYLGVIAHPHEAAAFRAALLRRLASDHDFSEFGIALTRDHGAWTESIRQTLSDVCHTLRAEPGMTSYQAHLAQGFTHYVSLLSSGTRRQLWQKRKLLEQFGPVRFEEVPAAEIPKAFAEMNELHSRRWGKPAYDQPTIEFHMEFMAMPHRNLRAAMSRLWVGDRLISILHDVASRDRQYNLQMGFDPSLDQRLSIGILHLGFAMERASAAGVNVYDFLGGEGMRRNYKRALSQQSTSLRSVWLIRGCALASGFRIYDWWQSIKGPGPQVPTATA